MSGFKVGTEDDFVFVKDGAGDVVLCFQSENAVGDFVAMLNILEVTRRHGFRQAQEMLDKSVPA
jgi:hypothetical protein